MTTPYLTCFDHSDRWLPDSMTRHLRARRAPQPMDVSHLSSVRSTPLEPPEHPTSQRALTCPMSPCPPCSSATLPYRTQQQQSTQPPLMPQERPPKKRASAAPKSALAELKSALTPRPARVAQPKRPKQPKQSRQPQLSKPALPLPAPRGIALPTRWQLSTTPNRPNPQPLIFSELNERILTDRRAHFTTRALAVLDRKS